MSAAAKLISKRRAAMIIQQPFFATLALGLEPTEDTTCESMWTDGRKLGFNPAYVESLKPSELEGVIVEEVMHCANQHHTRRGNRDVKRWNRACDQAIFPTILAAGFKLPNDIAINPAYAGRAAEEIYSMMKKEEEQAGKDGKQGQNGKPDDKASAGQQGAAGQQPGATGQQPAAGQQPASAGQQPGKGDGRGEIRDAAPAHDKAALAAAEMEWTANVRQALAAAKRHNAGTMPGYLQALDVASIAPKIDWKNELRAFIDESNVKDFSWSEPDRRFLWQDVILPGYVSDSLSHLILAIDDSYSIDQEIFSQIASEAAAALDEGAADKITVLFCNTAVHSVQSFDRGDVMTITARGSGGTKFAPVFDWVDHNAPDASCIVYLTDMDSTDYGTAPAVPVLWAAYGDSKRLPALIARAPFGTAINVAA